MAGGSAFGTRLLECVSVGTTQARSAEVLAHLADVSRDDLPAAYELRYGQIYRWVEQGDLG